MPRRRQRGLLRRGPDELLDWQREVLIGGAPVLNVPPPMTFRAAIAWGDSPEAAAAWRRHRGELIATHGTEIWGVLRYDRSMTRQEIAVMRRQEYIEQQRQHDAKQAALAQRIEQKRQQPEPQPTEAENGGFVQ